MVTTKTVVSLEIGVLVRRRYGGEIERIGGSGRGG